jgi:hypothetical protein
MRFLDYLKRFTYTPNEFYDYLKLLEDAASGDVDLVILPAMTGEQANGPALEPTATEANVEGGLTVPVEIRAIRKTSGDVLGFFNGTREVKVICASTGGTVAINDEAAGAADADVTADLSFVNGVCKFTVTMGGTWAANDTIKVTVDDDNVGIMGYAVEKNNHYLIKVKADPA